jgi:N-formylglutamate amidohydrolase
MVYRRSEDMDVDVLFDAASTLGLPMLKAHFGRTFVDVNRARNDVDPASVDGTPSAPYAPSAKAELGKGVVWMAALPDGDPLYAGRLSVGEIETRLATYWDPYRTALLDLLAGVHATHGKVFYVDCHSMPAVSTATHEEGAGKARADIVLGDRKGQSCAPAFTALAAEAMEREGFAVAINEPYQGADLVGSHGNPSAGRHALQIEVNRALYMDEDRITRIDRFEDTQARLGRALGAIKRGVAALS